jgi:hypothetical protein
MTILWESTRWRIYRDDDGRAWLSEFRFKPRRLATMSRLRITRERVESERDPTTIPAYVRDRILAALIPIEKGEF